MNLFSNKDKNEELFHAKYKLLNNEPTLYNERKIIEKWAEGFIDRDGAIIEEFKKKFHPVLWEFYLHQLLKNMGETIDFSKHRPDFIVKNADGSDKFYIEARISAIKQNGRPESERNILDIFTTEMPVWKLKEFQEIINEGVIRNSRAFKDKFAMYRKYSTEAWFSTEVPYIIGVCSFSQINYGLESHYSILALLYGAYIEYGGNTHGKCPVIKRNENSTVETNLFNDKKYADVSAVLFTSKLTLGKLTALSISTGQPSFNSVFNVYQDIENRNYIVKEISNSNPEQFSDGLFLFHNPNAKNPLDPAIFTGQGIIQVFQKKIKKKSIRKKKLVFSKSAMPLICRVNRIGILPIKNLQKLSLEENFNT